MDNSIKAMCRRFAVQHIAYWRSAKGLPKPRAQQRKLALYWLGKMRGQA